MEDDGPDDSSVGYKRPPAANRFKAGKSGNPRGRPKQRGLKEIFLNAAASPMDRRYAEELRLDPEASQLETYVTSVFRRAHCGDPQAMRQVLALWMRYGSDGMEAGDDEEI